MNTEESLIADNIYGYQDSTITVLTHLANYHHSDKGTEADSRHGFTEIYDQFFRHLRNDKLEILEIGVFHGASLRTMYDYFPNANIHGIDILPKKQYENDRITTTVLDQSNPTHLASFVEQSTTKYDIIIDDGSHHMIDQQLSLYYLSKLLKNGGIYIIEDLHTSLAPSNHVLYGKPIELMPDKSNSTLNLLKNKPFNSMYLTTSQNQELTAQYDDVFIFDRVNELVPDVYGGASITSILLKNHKA